MYVSLLVVLLGRSLAVLVPVRSAYEDGPNRQQQPDINQTFHCLLGFTLPPKDFVGLAFFWKSRDAAQPFASHPRAHSMAVRCDKMFHRLHSSTLRPKRTSNSSSPDETYEVYFSCGKVGT